MIEDKATATAGRSGQSGRMRTLGQFLLGIFYLLAVSLLVTAATADPSDRSLSLEKFLLIFFGVTCGALLLSALALTWLTMWAVRKDSRLGQFGIGSLLFLTLFTALFFAAVRWLAIQSTAAKMDKLGGSPPCWTVAIACLILVAIGIPCMANWCDSILQAGIWLTRRRWVQRCIGALRRLRIKKTAQRP